MSSVVPRGGRRILLSTVSSDAHTWNLVFLQLLLEELGNEVTNLGPCVPDRLLLEAADEVRPDAVVISTVNGHGRLDGARVIRKLRGDPVLRNLPVIIGGKLGTMGETGHGPAQSLIDAGFDAVFSDSADARLIGRLLHALPASRPTGTPTGERAAELCSGPRAAEDRRA